MMTELNRELAWAKMPITNEPQIGLRFVVLAHTGWKDKNDHFDLCLEERTGENPEDSVLVELGTSAPPNGLLFNAEFKQLIRRRYLTYQGSMSNHRGSVKRVDQGAYLRISKNVFRFFGQFLNGIYTATYAGTNDGVRNYLFQSHEREK